VKWMLIVVGALVLLIAIVAAIGATLPRNHVASRTLRIRRSPDEIWAAVTQAMRASSVPVDIVENDPPRRLVTKVKETEKMFGGTWTVTAAAGEPGSTLTIVEDGWVANPIFRFMSRYVIGHHRTMDGILKTVAKSFGEEASLSGE
jgi:hypothetical protein